MEQELKKFRDRLRISIILYVFSERLDTSQSDRAAQFSTEIKLQALDFLVRYPDFFSMELLDLIQSGERKDLDNIKQIIRTVFVSREPEIRVEEMEKFFHGAYESIDDLISYLVSVNFLKYESKTRSDGREFEKQYYLTEFGIKKIEASINIIESATWYADRCQTIKKYFSNFSGSDLKRRQYRYTEEYANIPYRGKIKQLQEKVHDTYYKIFNEVLA